jgi:nucleoside-diphosphate-sugar epimerase
MSVEPPPRSFVTGADGFIGSRLVSALLDRGHLVRALLRPGKAPRRLASLRGRQNLEIVNGDICTSPSLLGEQSVDFVFHLAAALIVARDAEYDRVNWGGTVNLINQVQQNAPDLRRFVYVSSVAAAGPSSDGSPLNEASVERPVSRYGMSKLRAERELTAANVPVPPFTILRPSVVFGPGRRGPVATMLNAARSGIRLEFKSSTRMLSFVHVDDLVEAIVMSASSARAENRTYFVAADDALDLNQTLARALEATDRTPRLTLRLGPRTLYVLAALGELVGAISRTRPAVTRDKWREVRQEYWVCSSTRIQSDLGWRPRVDRNGLVRLLLQQAGARR